MGVDVFKKGDAAHMMALHIISMLAWAGHSNVQKVFYTLYEANPAALFIQDIYTDRLHWIT